MANEKKIANATEEKANTTEKKQPKEFYSWSGQMYSEESVKRFCAEQSRNWAWILHDKDVWTEEDEKKNPQHKAGTLKTPHYHFVVTFDQRKSFKQIVRLMALYKGEQNAFAEPVHAGLADALEYLTHKNDASKYQYDKRKVVISSAQWYERYVTGNDETDNDRFIDDLLCPKQAFSIVGMARKYGRDFIRNVRSYMEFRQYALQEQAGMNAIDIFRLNNQAEEFNTMKGLVQENETVH